MPVRLDTSTWISNKIISSCLSSRAILSIAVAWTEMPWRSHSREDLLPQLSADKCLQTPAPPKLISAAESASPMSHPVLSVDKNLWVDANSPCTCNSQGFLDSHACPHEAIIMWFQKTSWIPPTQMCSLPLVGSATGEPCFCLLSP